MLSDLGVAGLPAPGYRTIAAHCGVDRKTVRRYIEAAQATARRIGEWEREQTHTSLLPYLEEESAEFAAAVRNREPESEILKELGDIFLQVLFHAEISAFSLDDVAQSFVTKMRARAPYLFDGTAEIVDVDTQERLWRAGKEM